MHKDKYVQEMEGLDTGSKRRLSAYAGQLSTDRYSTNKDKHVLEVLRNYALDVEYVDSIIETCMRRGYTQSWYRASYIESQLARFTEPSHPWFGWNKHYRRAKEDLMKRARKLNLRMLQTIDDESVKEAIAKLSSHSGWTYILSGHKPKGENLDKIFLRYAEYEREAVEFGQFHKPILIGCRTQTAPPFDPVTGAELPLEDWTPESKCKTRLVSMIDMFQNIASAKFGKPFQRAWGWQQSYAGGKTDEQINGYLQEWRDKYEHWFSSDFSSYDQTIPAWGINDAFDVIEEAFKGDPNFDAALFNVVRKSTISKAFVNAKGELVFSNRGEPSGETFTNLVDTIFNEMMQRTYQYSIGNDDFRCMIMGDDNIIFTKFKIDSEHLSTYLTKNFGITCNATKCSQGTREQHPQFLSRFWTPSGAWRHPAILISKMCFPEHFRDYKVAKDGKYLDPIVILYAYILSFPAGMRQLVNIDKFERENASKLRNFKKEDLVHGSGSLRYRIEYGLI